MMAYFISEEETLHEEGIRRLQRTKLTAIMQEVRAKNRFYAQKFDNLKFDPQNDPISNLPFTTRSELQQDQIGNQPYGTWATYPTNSYNRFHQTSGSTGTPLRLLDNTDSWDWWTRCWSIVMRAAGVNNADRIVFPFSFGPFIGFWAAFESATRLGAMSLPAGGMSTSARLRYILENDVTVICCTPTYAMRMVHTAAEQGVNIADSAVRLLIVAGEPGGSMGPIRDRIESAWGARVIDHAGATEVGAWGFECEQRPGGIHIIESEFIAEVIDPDSQNPVPDGQPGELVLTNLGRPGMPVIRYRTGDRVILTRTKCDCGRHFAWAEGGVTGRIDDMLLIRGNNVFPSAIEAIISADEDVAEFRLEVFGDGTMNELEISVEPVAGADGIALADGVALADRVGLAIRDRLHFRPIVRPVDPGTLPRFEMKAQRVVRRQ